MGMWGTGRCPFKFSNVLAVRPSNCLIPCVALLSTTLFCWCDIALLAHNDDVASLLTITLWAVRSTSSHYSAMCSWSERLSVSDYWMYPVATTEKRWFCIAADWSSDSSTTKLFNALAQTIRRVSISVTSARYRNQKTVWKLFVIFAPLIDLVYGNTMNDGCPDTEIK